jgi:hypothetical protein
MNILKTVIVVPMRSKGVGFLFRPQIKFKEKQV